MLVAQDFRERARMALSGKWGLGVGTGFVASLLGAGTIFSGAGSSGGSSSSSEEDYETMFSKMPEDVAMVVAITILAIVGISLLYALVMFVISGPITLGYVKFNLNLVDNNNPQFNDLFSMFSRFGDGFLVQFLRNLFVWLWTMAFMIPAVILAIVFGVIAALAGGDVLLMIVICVTIFGIAIPASVFVTVKQYSYAMAAYILYENPGMGAYKAIKESQQLMKGNKWRLFCLGFSFIGWAILSVFTLGIGTLWLRPYQEAAYAAFYREIKRERYGESIPQYNMNNMYY